MSENVGQKSRDKVYRFAFHKGAKADGVGFEVSGKAATGRSCEGSFACLATNRNVIRESSLIADPFE